jgi:hypothetical protein
MGMPNLPDSALAIFSEFVFLRIDSHGIFLLSTVERFERTSGQHRMSRSPGYDQSPAKGAV